MFIGVRESCRRDGLGTQIYGKVFQELANLGVTRVDAQIDLDNLQGIGLHKKVGFALELYSEPYNCEGIFATKDIGPATKR